MTRVTKMTKVIKMAINFQSRVVLPDNDVPGAVNEARQRGAAPSAQT